jgi:hypothetical protein
MPDAALPKPNPLVAAPALQGSRPADVVIGSEPAFRDGVTEQQQQQQPLLPPSAAGATSARPKRRRVDTSALTGVRGLAALHVALGHMFSFSTLRLDLIGGAAMPFLCASPRLASPRLASPRLASPRLASPRLACAWLPHRMETR